MRGAEADAAAKRVIADAGHLEHTVSRTGHSIDRYGLHGFGPPIDDTETYDDRLLLPGVGFSVEPGVYLPGVAGVRSEVNVVVQERDILITPDHYQTDLARRLRVFLQAAADPVVPRTRPGRRRSDVTLSHSVR